MNFGYFDDEKREYVITRPDTPGAVGELSGVTGVWCADFK